MKPTSRVLSVLAGALVLAALVIPSGGAAPNGKADDLLYPSADRVQLGARVGRQLLQRTDGPGSRTGAYGDPSYSGGQADSPIVPWDAYVPSGAGPFPLVLVIHGGSWYSGTKSKMRTQCVMLRDAGYTAIALDYTLATATRPGYPTAVNESLRLINWARNDPRFKIKVTRTGILGISAGGTIAHEIGMRARNKPSAIATASGVQNVRGISGSDPYISWYIGCSPTECSSKWAQASPMETTGTSQPETLLMNSTNELVPASDPTNYLSRLQGLGVPSSLELYSGSLHGGALFTRDDAKADLLEFFASTLQ